MTRWTKDDVARVLAQQAKSEKRPKYGAQKMVVDNIVFDSKKEAARYNELKLLEKAGRVTLVAVHSPHPIRVQDVFIANYEADFVWEDRVTGQTVVEDVKSPATRKKESYRLKKKLVEAIYGIQIRET